MTTFDDTNSNPTSSNGHPLDRDPRPDEPDTTRQYVEQYEYRTNDGDWRVDLVGHGAGEWISARKTDIVGCDTDGRHYLPGEIQ